MAGEGGRTPGSRVPDALTLFGDTGPSAPSSRGSWAAPAPQASSG